MLDRILGIAREVGPAGPDRLAGRPGAEGDRQRLQVGRPALVRPEQEREALRGAVVAADVEGVAGDERRRGLPRAPHDGRRLAEERELRAELVERSEPREPALAVTPCRGLLERDASRARERLHVLPVHHVEGPEGVRRADEQDGGDIVADDDRRGEHRVQAAVEGEEAALDRCAAGARAEQRIAPTVVGDLDETASRDDGSHDGPWIVAHDVSQRRRHSLGGEEADPPALEHDERDEVRVERHDGLRRDATGDLLAIALRGERRAERFQPACPVQDARVPHRDRGVRGEAFEERELLGHERAPLEAADHEGGGEAAVHEDRHRGQRMDPERDEGRKRGRVVAVLPDFERSARANDVADEADVYGCLDANDGLSDAGRGGDDEVLTVPHADGGVLRVDDGERGTRDRPKHRVELGLGGELHRDALEALGALDRPLGPDALGAEGAYRDRDREEHPRDERRVADDLHRRRRRTTSHPSELLAAPAHEVRGTAGHQPAFAETCRRHRGRKEDRDEGDAAWIRSVRDHPHRGGGKVEEERRRRLVAEAPGPAEARGVPPGDDGRHGKEGAGGEPAREIDELPRGDEPDDADDHRPEAEGDQRIAAPAIHRTGRYHRAGRRAVRQVLIAGSVRAA